MCGPITAGMNKSFTILTITINSNCHHHLRELYIKGTILNYKLLLSKNVVELESTNQVWKRVMSGLPAGELSFLLRTATDTSPNLKCWNTSCPLCGHKFITSFQIVRKLLSRINIHVHVHGNMIVP